MLKWLFTLVLAVLIIGVFTPWFRNTGLRNAGLRNAGLGKTGVGRIAPGKQGQRHVRGDFEVESGGKRFSFPIGSTILLSLLASLIFWLLR